MILPGTISSKITKYKQIYTQVVLQSNCMNKLTLNIYFHLQYVNLLYLNFTPEVALQILPYASCYKGLNVSQSSSFRTNSFSISVW